MTVWGLIRNFPRWRIAVLSFNVNLKVKSADSSPRPWGRWGNSNSKSLNGCFKLEVRGRLTLVPAKFLQLFASKWGRVFYPIHISSSKAHSKEIPTAIPIFSGSTSFSTVPLLTSRDLKLTSSRNPRWLSPK